MKLEKLIIPTIAMLIFCCLFGIPSLVKFLQKPKYKTITLEKEPDYIGSTGYGEELAIVTDGKLVLYNKEGEARNIELDIYVTKVYPLGESIWVIDDKLNLYQVTYGNDNQVVMSDVILSDVGYIECNDSQTAAINSKGELYVWGYNSYGELGIKDMEYIDEPTKIDYISNVKSCALYNGNGIVLTEEGEVYVSGLNAERNALIREFTRLEELSDIQNIICSNRYVYTRKNDGTILVWNSLDFKTSEDIKIWFIDKEKTDAINDLQINQFSMGYRYVLGLNSQGNLYYWENDFIEGLIGKNDYSILSEPRKIPDLDRVDSMYATKMDAYAKKGLVIYIIPGK